MSPILYIGMYDLTYRLKIRKAIIQPKSWRAVAFFQYPNMERPIFSASVTFQVKEGTKWYTSFAMNAAEDVIVDRVVELELKSQLTAIFSPYFTSLFLGERPW
jgi:hypothetical protein